MPKGSFYHYFRSKEGYGVELLRRYFEKYDGKLVSFLSKDAGSARDCLLHYFDGWLETHRCDEPQRCCLAVKLAAEVSDLSEPMREALAEGMGFVVRNLAACIRRGQQEGSLDADLLPDETASALYSLWVGSALLFKTQHSRARRCWRLWRTRNRFCARLSLQNPPRQGRSLPAPRSGLF
ncbi:TetR/AcrR family transcriptional regulator [Chromobacterium haemolyticum]|nr:TetR/AcrR family transcriptional regulator [Chromobacterium haemolyticum]